MAFVKINKSAIGSKFGPPEVRMGSHLQSDKQSSRGIYIAISMSAAEQAKWTLTDSNSGKRETISLELLEGTGDDAGFLMITPTDDATGYTVGREKGKGQALSFSVSYSRLRHYVLNDLPVDPHTVDFTIEDDGSLLIQCPDWLRYNPQSVPEEKPPEPPPKSPSASVHDMHLNRQDRRALAKRVASRLK